MTVVYTAKRLLGGVHARADVRAEHDQRGASRYAAAPAPAPTPVSAPAPAPEPAPEPVAEPEKAAAPAEAQEAQVAVEMSEPSPEPAAQPASGEATISADAVMAVIGAAKEDPNCLKMEYTSSSKLTDGLATEVQLPGGHTLTVDEPETMPGGQNKGPNPLDVMCGSLGTCQEITYKMYATGTQLAPPPQSPRASVSAPPDCVVHRLQS